MHDSPTPALVSSGAIPRRVLLAAATFACLVIVCVLSEAPPRTSAATQATIALDFDVVTPGIQSQADVPFGATAVPVDVVVLNADKVGAFEFVLNFTVLTLHFASWTEGPFLGSTGRVTQCHQLLTENSVRIGCTTKGPPPPEGASGDGLLATLFFHPQVATEICLPLVLVETALVFGDPLPTEAQSGCITFVAPTSTPAPTPTVTSVPSPQPTSTMGAGTATATAQPGTTQTVTVTHTPPSGPTRTATQPATNTVVPANTPTLANTAIATSTSPPTICPRSPGFWKNHPDEWPLDQLRLGSFTYTKGALLWMVTMPTQGDASLILARQLIAAKLNTAIGAPPPAGTIALADSLLGAYAGSLPYAVDPGSYQGQGMVWAAAGLAAALNQCGAVTDDPESSNTVLGNASPSPRGLPGTGSWLNPFRQDGSAWLVTALSLVIAVLLVVLLRNTVRDDRRV